MRQRVLAVDDDAVTLEMIKYYLCDDYDVETLLSPQVCVDVACKTLPDLILLDLSMPDMDGFSVCNLLKENKHTTHIPIIILTANEETSQRIKGYNRGAVDYLTKPIDPPCLLEKVRSAMDESN